LARYCVSRLAYLTHQAFVVTYKRFFIKLFFMYCD
jgi:hypothetical protein